MKRSAGKAPYLTRSQVHYIQRAFRLREQLTNAALAAKFQVSRSTITAYSNSKGLHGCREDYYLTVEHRRSRRLARMQQGLE